MQTSRLLKLIRDKRGNQEYHPILELDDLLSDVDATIPDKINILKTQLKYTEAEHKAVELNVGYTGEPVRMSIDIDGNQI